MKITIRVTEDATNRYGTVTGERVIIDCSDQTFTPTLTANFLRAFADEIAPRRRDVQRTLNCPVCGSGEEGDCICVECCEPGGVFEGDGRG